MVSSYFLGSTPFFLNSVSLTSLPGVEGAPFAPACNTRARFSSEASRGEPASKQSAILSVLRVLVPLCEISSSNLLDLIYLVRTGITKSNRRVAERTEDERTETTIFSEAISCFFQFQVLVIR